ncbi:MAG: hypothetical protein ACOCV4_08370 [Myxococcota bacterium]
MTRRDRLKGAATASGGAPAPAGPRRTPAARTSVDMERFVADCVEAAEDDRPQEAVREVLARAVSDPRATLAAVGDPDKAGLTVFHRSENLTILAAAWTPQMNLMPHNHLMWALIGIYTGREDNILWRNEDGRLTGYGAKCLFEGDVAALPDTVIHSVTNPLERFTGGIHIYGGDFFATKRSQWDPETLTEHPSDGEVMRRVFDRANARARCVTEGG